MRKFTSLLTVLTLPVLALSGCSAIDQPYMQSANDASYGQYAQGCSSSACASGQSYSVAANQSHSYHEGYHGGSHTGVNATHWPDSQLVSNYEYGGPVHVSPTGFGHNGAGYGGQYGPQYGHSYSPQLRGLRAQKRGNFYGTLGGVWYDTDVDSFGLEGRLGYDSGKILGAEIEGSIGVINEDLGSVDGVDVSAGFDYNVAAFAVGRLPLGQRLSLHSRVGYDFRKLSVTGEADDASAAVGVDLDGLAYGFGGEYALSQRDGLRLDFTEYRGGAGVGTQSLSASYTRKF